LDGLVKDKADIDPEILDGPSTDMSEDYEGINKMISDNTEDLEGFEENSGENESDIDGINEF